LLSFMAQSPPDQVPTHWLTAMREKTADNTGESLDLTHIAGSSKVSPGAPRGPFPNPFSRFLGFAGVSFQRGFVQHDRHLAGISVPGDFPDHPRESLPLGFCRKKRPSGGEPEKEFARLQGIAAFGFDIREAGERIEYPILERPWPRRCACRSCPSRTRRRRSGG